MVGPKLVTPFTESCGSCGTLMVIAFVSAWALAQGWGFWGLRFRVYGRVWCLLSPKEPRG